MCGGGRALAMREDVAPKAFFCSGIFWFPIPIAAGFIALCSGTLGINITDPDMVGPVVAGNILGTGGAAIIFVVVFCSLGSSIDSLLASTSDLLTEDIYKKMINPKVSETKLRRMTSIIIIGLGIVTWMICLPRLGDLIIVLFLSGPLVGSAIWPIIAGLYWEKANSQGALCAMLLGSTIGLIAYYQIGWFTASLISTAVSLVITYFSTILFPQPFDWKSLNEFKEA